MDNRCLVVLLLIGLDAAVSAVDAQQSVVLQCAEIANEGQGPPCGYPYLHTAFPHLADGFNGRCRYLMCTEREERAVYVEEDDFSHVRLLVILI